MVMPSEGNELAGKTALISGGTGGIGVAIAKKYLKSGANVIIAGTSKDKLDRICKDVNNNNLKTIDLNYEEPSTFDKKVAEAARCFGRIDIFVSSSGIHVDRDGLDFINTTVDEYDKIMGVNLRGTYFMCQSIAKYMIANQIKGHILIVSSQSALEPSWSPYRLSKLGIAGITRGMAQRLLEHGIIVNAIGPGPTATGMQKEYRGGVYTHL